MSRADAVFSPAAKRATAFRATASQISASEHPMRAELFTRVRASVAATLKAAGLRGACEVTVAHAGHGVTRFTLTIPGGAVSSKDWHAELNPVNSIEQASQRSGWIAQALIARALVRCLDGGARLTGPLAEPPSPLGGEAALGEGRRGNPPPVEARIEMALRKAEDVAHEGGAVSIAPADSGGADSGGASGGAASPNGHLARRKGKQRSPTRLAIEALAPGKSHVVRIGVDVPTRDSLQQLVYAIGGRRAGLLIGRARAVGARTFVTVTRENRP